MEFSFPRTLRLGVSAAAAQIEGGDVGSSWNDWYSRGHIKDGSDPADSDHWVRWKEDADLMASMGIRDYRMGIEWARLLPEPGKPDEAAILRYREEIEYLQSLGIRVLLTIHHFANPMWFERKGAFTKRENLGDYLDLVRLTVERFGDLVSDYITINEPNVYAVNGYAFGIWPPAKVSFPDTFAVMENMACCHIRAYELIHAMRQARGYFDTAVSFANHVRVFDPENPADLRHRVLAKGADWLFQGALTRAMTLGEFLPPLRNHWNIRRGEYADFIGINYYTRSAISGLRDGTMPNTPRNDLDWEIYPKGLIRCARSLLSVLDRPIWVTENGTCDLDDRFRSRYLFAHLREISLSGLPFERYYHWCFCDNFEWIEGNTAKFGLVRIDPETRKRTVKQSGEFYSEILRNGGVTEAMFRKFVSKEAYSIR